MSKEPSGDDPLVKKIMHAIKAHPTFNAYQVADSLGMTDSSSDQRQFGIAFSVARRLLEPKGIFVRAPKKGEAPGEYVRCEGDEGVMTITKQMVRRLDIQAKQMARVAQMARFVHKVAASKKAKEKADRRAAEILAKKAKAKDEAVK